MRVQKESTQQSGHLELKQVGLMPESHLSDRTSSRGEILLSYYSIDNAIKPEEKWNQSSWEVLWPAIMLISIHLVYRRRGNVVSVKYVARWDLPGGILLGVAPPRWLQASPSEEYQEQKSPSGIAKCILFWLILGHFTFNYQGVVSRMCATAAETQHCNPI